jgi:hypothetical protein
VTGKLVHVIEPGGEGGLFANSSTDLTDAGESYSIWR